ncbi:MFS transporter [Chloroflexota bacterium]
MAKKKGFHKIYFGWWTVISGGITSMWSAGYYHYGFSALIEPIQNTLGLSRMAASVPASIGRLEGGIESPISGLITDKFGPRLIASLGALFFGLSLASMYFVNSQWTFYIIWGVLLGTAYNLASTIPVNTAITNWFVRLRGRALGTKITLAGLSGVITLPIVAWLIDTYDWRTACVVGGVVMLCVPLPLLALSLRRYRPEYYGLLPDGKKSEEKDADAEQTIDRGVKYASTFKEFEYTLRQAIKTPAFWMLIISHASHNMAVPVLNVHAIPLLTGMGLTTLRAAFTMSIMVWTSIPFRFIGGILADRVGKGKLRMLLAGSYLLQAIGFGVYIRYGTLTSVYIWLALYGVGMGTAFAANPLIRARYFGRKAFGSIHGLAQALMTPVGIAAPIYAGWVYDTNGSYMMAIKVGAITLVASVVLSLMIFPPKPPARITHIRDIV